jgi:hypothetical protein
MHPNTLNEMQHNIIEISYRPEKIHAYLYAALQKSFSSSEFTATDT